MNNHASCYSEKDWIVLVLSNTRLRSQAFSTKRVTSANGLQKSYVQNALKEVRRKLLENGYIDRNKRDYGGSDEENKNLQPPELSWKIIEWRETKGLSE